MMLLDFRLANKIFFSQINKSESLVLFFIVEALICHGPIYILSDAPFQRKQTSLNRFNTNTSLRLPLVHPFFRNIVWI